MEHFAIFIYNDEGYAGSDLVDDTQKILEIVTSGCAVEVCHCNEIGFDPVTNYQDQFMKTDSDGFASPLNFSLKK